MPEGVRETEIGQGWSPRPGAVAAGFILLAVGAAMLLDTTGIVQVRSGRIIPPMVLIALGVSILVDKGAFVVGHRMTRDERGERVLRVRRRGDPSNGFWLIGIGAWMLVSELHLFGLSFHTSWPLFIVFAGVMMVLRGVSRPRCGERPKED